MSIPTTMQALLLVDYVKSFDDTNWKSSYETRTVPVPQVGPNQVLIKVAASPINPIDFFHAQGHYGALASQPLPQATGFEGSGTVVSGTESLLDKRVAFFLNNAGAWAEYVVVPASSCVVLPDHVSLDDGASAFINPLTVVGMVEKAHAKGSKAIVNTAGASALGKQLLRHATEEGIDVIAVVRRPQQVQSLQALGAKYVVDTSVANWQTTLSELAATVGATIAFDAVGGELFGQVLTALPPNSDMYSYGILSDDLNASVHISNLLQGKKLAGYYVFGYMGDRFYSVAQEKVAPKLSTTFKTSIRKKYTLEEGAIAIEDYLNQMSNDKVAFQPF